MGNYDECQALPHAHYCLLTVNNNNPSLLTTGLCAPIECGADDLDRSSHYILKSLNVSIPDGAISKIQCISKDQLVPPTAGAAVVLAVVGLLIVLALTGTVVDYVDIQQQKSAELAKRIPNNTLVDERDNIHTENDDDDDVSGTHRDSRWFPARIFFVSRSERIDFDAFVYRKQFTSTLGFNK